MHRGKQLHFYSQNLLVQVEIIWWWHFLLKIYVLAVFIHFSSSRLRSMALFYGPAAVLQMEMGLELICMLCRGPDAKCPWWISSCLVRLTLDEALQGIHRENGPEYRDCLVHSNAPHSAILDWLCQIDKKSIAKLEKVRWDSSEVYRRHHWCHNKWTHHLDRSRLKQLKFVWAIGSVGELKNTKGSIRQNCVCSFNRF